MTRPQRSASPLSRPHLRPHAPGSHLSILAPGVAHTQSSLSATRFKYFAFLLLSLVCVILSVGVAPAAAHDMGEVSKKGFLFHDDDTPFSLPMDIYVSLIGMNNNGARRVTADAGSIAQSLFNSLPAGRPSCLQNGKPLHAQYLMNYHVFHSRLDAVDAVERLIAEHMVIAVDDNGRTVTAPVFIPAKTPEGYADAMYLDDDEDEQEATTAKGHGAKPSKRPGQHVSVPVFDVELTEIESALDGIVIQSLETEMISLGIDVTTHRPFHESGVIILNPEKERMRKHMRPEQRAHLTNALDGNRQTLPFVYRYRYNGGAPTKQWVGYGRHVFMDLTALPGTYGASSSGEGTVSKETIPALETALDHKVASTLTSPDELMELYDEAENRVGGPAILPSTRFLSRLVSVTINAVRKVFVADTRFSKIEYAERIIVPIIVLRNHEQFASFSTDAPLAGEKAGQFEDAKIDLNTLRFELNQMLLPSQELVLTTMTHSIHEHQHVSSSVFDALMEDTVHTPAAAGANAVSQGYVAKTVHYLDSEVLISQLVSSSSSDALLTAMATQQREARTKAEADARAYRAAHSRHDLPPGSNPDELNDTMSDEEKEAIMNAEHDADAAAIDRTLSEARKGVRNSASSSSVQARSNKGSGAGTVKDRRKAWEKQADETLKSWRQRAYADELRNTGGAVHGVKRPSRQRILPVFVYSLLGLPEGVLLDRTHVATPSARGSLVVALQTLASEIPLPYFSDDGVVTVSPRNPTRGILAALVSALGGIVPPYVEYIPQKRKLSFDYTWAIGQHAFGPFSTTTSMSQTFQDAVLRNSVLTRLSGTVKLVKSAVHELARFHRHFIADPLSQEFLRQKVTDLALFGSNSEISEADTLAVTPDLGDAARDASLGADAWFASLKQYRHYARAASQSLAASVSLSPFAEAVLVSLVSDLEKLDVALLAVIPLLAAYKWDVASEQSAVLVASALSFKNKVRDEIASARYELSCCRKVYSVYGNEPSLHTLAEMAHLSEITTSAAKTLNSAAAGAAAGLGQLKEAAAETASQSYLHASASIKSRGGLTSLLMVALPYVAVLVLLVLVVFVAKLVLGRNKAKAAKAGAVGSASGSTRSRGYGAGMHTGGEGGDQPENSMGGMGGMGGGNGGGYGGFSGDGVGTGPSPSPSPTNGGSFASAVSTRSHAGSHGSASHGGAGGFGGSDSAFPQFPDSSNTFGSGAGSAASGGSVGGAGAGAGTEDESAALLRNPALALATPPSASAYGSPAGAGAPVVGVSTRNFPSLSVTSRPSPALSVSSLPPGGPGAPGLSAPGVGAPQPPLSTMNATYLPAASGFGSLSASSSAGSPGFPAAPANSFASFTASSGAVNTVAAPTAAPAAAPAAAAAGAVPLYQSPYLQRPVVTPHTSAASAASAAGTPGAHSHSLAPAAPAPAALAQPRFAAPPAFPAMPAPFAAGSPYSASGVSGASSHFSAGSFGSSGSSGLSGGAGASPSAAPAGPGLGSFAPAPAPAFPVPGAFPGAFPGSSTGGFAAGLSSPPRPAALGAMPGLPSFAPLPPMPAFPSAPGAAPALAGFSPSFGAGAAGAAPGVKKND